MDGLTIFNEIFDKDPPEPLDKTANDGAFHVAMLNANKSVSPVIMAMYTATAPLFVKFMSDKTVYDKNAGDLMIMNASFETLEKGLNGVFSGYQRTIAAIYPPGSDEYKALFWVSITDMFNVGIADKMSNVDRFLLVLDGDVSLAAVNTDLLAKQAAIVGLQESKITLKSQVDAFELVARASQKLFCIEEQGNAGGLMQYYKATPYLCNQYFQVTDIKHYKPTPGAIAKKEALIYEFVPNTITVVAGVLLSPSCKPSIKNISLETAKIGSTFDATVKPISNYPIDPGKTFKKNIKHIGSVDNTLLVVDTTGNTGNVKLRIEIK